MGLRSWGSPLASICQRRHGSLQRRRVNRTRDPHPSPGSKFDLDRRRQPAQLDKDVGPDSATTIAGTKPGRAAAFGSGRNERRHRSSNERETPYRRAVAATRRGACKLSRTILSFSSSDHRRRRPVSTTSSRSTWALRLSLSIRTVLNNTPHSARRPSPDGYVCP